MLKVWRGKGTFFAECTECGSFGTAPHLQPKTRMAPEIEQALEKHVAHMMALRGSYTKAANGIVLRIRDGSISRPEGTAQIRKLYENHVAQIRVAEAVLPDPSGKVTNYATECPWCNHAEEVDLEILPDDKTEPEFELAKPVLAHIAANMKKEASNV